MSKISTDKLPSGRNSSNLKKTEEKEMNLDGVDINEMNEEQLKERARQEAATKKHAHNLEV